MLIHPFKPIYNAQSRILILGSFPSETSRKQQFYYSHPSNRFWKLLATLFKTDISETREEKIQFLLTHHIALYDAVQACTVVKSDDAQIKNIVPADLDTIFQTAAIQKIYANGTKAYNVCVKDLKLNAIKLPSTSAANARYRFDDLIQEWQQITF